MSGAWVVRKRGNKTVRVGWYGYEPAAEHQAAALNAEYGTDTYTTEATK